MLSELSREASRISRRFNELEIEYRGEALAGFRMLERLDPETADLAVNAMDNRTVAALWLADHVGPLCSERPWDYIARGEGGEVRRVLKAAAQGLPA